MSGDTEEEDLPAESVDIHDPNNKFSLLLRADGESISADTIQARRKQILAEVGVEQSKNIRGDLQHVRADESVTAYGIQIDESGTKNELIKTSQAEDPTKKSAALRDFIRLSGPENELSDEVMDSNVEQINYQGENGFQESDHQFSRYDRMVREKEVALKGADIPVIGGDVILGSMYMVSTAYTGDSDDLSGKEFGVKSRISTSPGPVLDNGHDMALTDEITIQHKYISPPYQNVLKHEPRQKFGTTSFSIDLSPNIGWSQQNLAAPIRSRSALQFGDLEWTANPADVGDLGNTEPGKVELTYKPGSKVTYIEPTAANAIVDINVEVKFSLNIAGGPVYSAPSKTGQFGGNFNVGRRDRPYI